MKVLLDNCVNRKFVRLIDGHDVRHASEEGWADLSNGKLLDACEANGFEVLITVDKGIRFQQNFADRRVSLLTINSPRIDFDTVSRFATWVKALLDDGIRPGLVLVVGLDELREE